MFTVMIVLFIEKYVYTKFCLDWLLCERVTWIMPHVLPEPVYCCFTRTTLFLHDFMIRVITSPSFIALVFKIGIA